MIALKINCIKTKKFNNCCINFVFKQKLEKDIITSNSMLLDNLTYSTKNYPTRKDLLKRYEYLYGTYVRCNLTKVGEYMYSSLSIDFLNPIYCDKGYLKDILDILLEVVYNPNINNNAFDETTFKINKNNYHDYLISTKEKASLYAYKRSLEILNTKNISYNIEGYLEDFDNITNKSLINTYNNLINNSELEIYIVGHLDMNYIKDYLTKHIKDNNITKKLNIYNKLDRVDKYKDIEEYGDYTQDNLVIHYNMDIKTKKEREIILPVFNQLFGGGGLNTLLFTTVREKHSLCYSIRSFYNPFDNIFTITAGIDGKNKKLCLELIDKLFNDIKNGNISNKDIRDSIRFLKTKYKSFDSSIYNIYSYQFNHNNYDTYLPIDRIKLINTVTKEDIINIVNKININTVYMLRGNKHEEN